MGDEIFDEEIINLNLKNKELFKIWVPDFSELVSYIWKEKYDENAKKYFNKLLTHMENTIISSELEEFDAEIFLIITRETMDQFSSFSEVYDECDNLFKFRKKNDINEFKNLFRDWYNNERISPYNGNTIFESIQKGHTIKD